MAINRFDKVSIYVRFDPKGLGIIGDAAVDPLLDIWNGPKRKEWVRYHIQGRRDKIPKRQDFKGSLVGNGAFYINRVGNILKYNDGLSGKITIYEIPEFTLFELDEPDDWIIAELLMKKYILNTKKSKKKIKLFVIDVDGVLTDGRIVLGKGDELKFFNVHDGMGVTIAKRIGLKVGIITSRTSKATERRAKELEMDYIIQGSKNKLKSLDEILKIENMDYQNICYIGDDIIDIPLFRKVGFSATVNDAPEYVKSEVSYISNKLGGKGAVRDIIEYILKCEGTLNSIIEEMIDD